MTDRRFFRATLSIMEEVQRPLVLNQFYSELLLQKEQRRNLEEKPEEEEQV